MTYNGVVRCWIEWPRFSGQVSRRSCSPSLQMMRVAAVVSFRFVHEFICHTPKTMKEFHAADELKEHVAMTRESI